MRLPLPRNRLVQLTLVGALLTTAIAAGVVVPGVFTNPTASDSTSTQTNPGPDAPTPNDQFTPATSGGDGGEYEDEEYGEEYEDEEHEEEEYEDEEHEDEELWAATGDRAEAGE